MAHSQPVLSHVYFWCLDEPCRTPVAGFCNSRPWLQESPCLQELLVTEQTSAPVDKLGLVELTISNFTPAGRLKFSDQVPSLSSHNPDWPMQKFIFFLDFLLKLSS